MLTQVNAMSRVNFTSRRVVGLFIIIFLSLLSVSPSHSAQAILAWDPSSSPGVIGYKIYYTSDHDNSTHSVTVGNVTSYIITDLKDGTNYYFVVAAYDSSGNESPYSNQVPPAPCTFKIPQGSTFINNSGETRSVSVNTQFGCAWSVASNTPWILITSNATGTGKGNVYYSVSPNDASSSRSGTITIAGQTLTINQGKYNRYVSTDSP